jgi:hypothetical protein
MLRLIVGIFVILHGLVHLLYVGQARRLFELQPGMTWPDGSWAFSKLFGDDATRWLASIGCVLAAVGFVAAGAGLLMRQLWWRPMAVGAAALSTVLFILFWDGALQGLDNKGIFAILINIAIMVVVLVLKL